MPAITEAFVKSVKLPEGKAELFVRDHRLPGFALRVRPKADGALSRVFMAIWEDRPDKDGNRKRRKASIGEWPKYSAEEARAVAKTMLQAAHQGDDPSQARKEKRAAPTWEDLEREFEPYLITRKPATVKSYRGVIRRNLKPYFGRFKVRDIQPETVRQFMQGKAENPIDGNRSLAVLSVMMGRAMELGWITANPCNGVRRNKENVRERWLDERELPLFVAALGAVEGVHADAIRFCAVTGWRISEVLGLTCADVSLVRGIAELGDTKTGRSIRALSSDAVAVIEQQGRTSGYVFSKTGTRRCDYRTVLILLKEICEKAGIEPITPHVLRHTAATWAAINGAEAHELREAFGWKTLAMTARYVSQSESLGRRGAERAASAMAILGNRPSDGLPDQAE